MGKISKEEQEKMQLQKKEEEEAEKKKLETLSIGARCQVQIPGQPTRRAAIRFIGELNFFLGLKTNIFLTIRDMIINTNKVKLS